MHYRELVICFEALTDGVYPVKVRAPSGYGRGHFELPFDAGELRAVKCRQRTRPRDLLSTDKQGRSTSTADLWRTHGKRLFEALFRNRVAALYHHGRGETDRDPGLGLRIVLAFAPEPDASAELAALPWELLYDPDRRQYLALDRQAPVVRRFEVGFVAPPAARSEPFRVLLAAANPPSSARLQLDREIEHIERALAPLPGVETASLPQATASELRAALTPGRTAVVHFLGHGAASWDRDAFGLWLFAKVGGDNRVLGPDLGEVFRGVGLRAAVLNACDTGVVPSGPGHDPLDGAASALAAAGLPVVIGMQSRIEDRAAVAFSQTLYRELARGQPAEAAVVEGRLALKAEKLEDWWTPVLFVSPSAEAPLPEPPDRSAAPAIPGQRLPWLGQAAFWATSTTIAGMLLKASDRRVRLGSVDQLYLIIAAGVLLASLPLVLSQWRQLSRTRRGWRPAIVGFALGIAWFLLWQMATRPW